MSDEKETTSRNPKSYVAWKERAERLEEALKTIRNITDGHSISADRRDRIYQLSNDALTPTEQFLVATDAQVAALMMDDFNVRKVLLECLTILGVKNVAEVDECRTRDVADFLKLVLSLID